MYLKITLKELPRITLAHSHSTNHYDIQFPGGGPDRLEIACYQQGNAVWSYEDGTEIPVEVPRFMLRQGQIPMRAYSDEADCRHITVGFQAKYDLQKLDRNQLLSDSQNRHTGEMTFYMPEEGLSIRENSVGEAVLTQLISRYAVADREQSLRCMATLFELLSVLTAETLRMAVLQEGTLSPAGLRYAQKAVRYIASHLSEKLTVEELAERLDISTGYLGTLFKAYTGTSVVKYVNGAKMEKVQQLLLFRKMTLREAGESVGISDENYCSRLFKQYTGMSVREFLKCQRIRTEEV